MSDKRQQVIETAYALFRRDGFHAVGIDRIIAEAGVAKMTMYRHFPSKDDLIVAVLDHRTERFERQLDRLLAPCETQDEKIAAIIGWYDRWFARDDFHGCAFAHALAEYGDVDHPVHLAVQRQKQSFLGRLGAIVSESDVRGGGAAGLFMLFEGATLLAQIGRPAEAIAGLRQLAPACTAEARP